MPSRRQFIIGGSAVALTGGTVYFVTNTRDSGGGDDSVREDNATEDTDDSSSEDGSEDGGGDGDDDNSGSGDSDEPSSDIGLTVSGLDATEYTVGDYITPVFTITNDGDASGSYEYEVSLSWSGLDLSQNETIVGSIEPASQVGESVELYLKRTGEAKLIVDNDVVATIEVEPSGSSSSYTEPEDPSSEVTGNTNVTVTGS